MSALITSSKGALGRPRQSFFFQYLRVYGIYALAEPTHQPKWRAINHGLGVHHARSSRANHFSNTP
jgi:hypothetical protein